MNCKQCGTEIGRNDSYTRVDAGTRLRTGERVKGDVNLHHSCAGRWFEAHYPWLVAVRVRESA